MTIDITEVKKRLFAVLKNTAKVDEYLRCYGPIADVQNIRALDATISRRSRRREDAIMGGNDPIYSITVSCPVCSHAAVKGYELRAKSLMVTQNRLLVPIYKATPEYRAVDYTLLGVTVCPRCLFASPDKKDFSRPGTETAAEAKSQLTSAVIISLQEKIGERKNMLSGISDYTEYFDRPRIDQAALDSYRLAIARAKAESVHDLPYAYFKLGSYAVRMAKILKESGVNSIEMLRTALTYFEESFIRSDCLSEEVELQSIYLIVALSVKLSERQKVKLFANAFKNLYADSAVRKKRSAAECIASQAVIKFWGDKIELARDSMDDPSFFNEE